VRVEKPGALRFARSVGVEIQRTRADLRAGLNRAFISLGSNIDPERNLPEAARMLSARRNVASRSPVYQSPAVGSTGQPDFLNAAVLVETELGARALKATVLEPIEQELGRSRTADRYAPRTIDLDITLFNEEVLNLAGRHIPDPDILRYAYLAVPLSDIAPQQRHPETGQTLTEIVRGLSDREILRRLDVSL
jgi:2-amino-4-hydroxy-6-hydroxymethyldihydropteridine diphosphokinase